MNNVIQNVSCLNKDVPYKNSFNDPYGRNLIIVNNV